MTVIRNTFGWICQIKASSVKQELHGKWGYLIGAFSVGLGVVLTILGIFSILWKVNRTHVQQAHWILVKEEAKSRRAAA